MRYNLACLRLLSVRAHAQDIGLRFILSSLSEIPVINFQSFRQNAHRDRSSEELLLHRSDSSVSKV